MDSTALLHHYSLPVPAAVGDYTPVTLELLLSRKQTSNFSPHSVLSPETQSIQQNRFGSQSTT